MLLDKLNNFYLDRYGSPGPLINSTPKKGLKIIVIIPCHNEPNVTETLESLYNCELPDCYIEIIIVVNHAENSADRIKKFNIKTVETLEKWITIQKSKRISTFVIKAYDLSKKHAGVGLARKIGMDEAVRRFELIHDKKGIIVSLDADSLCSAKYLLEIHKTYTKDPTTRAALLHFEHPLEGNMLPAVYHGIINYELHLRYYKNALKFTHFPYSYHTVGSCITVTSEAYQKQGGMNKRKAGEDFYFLQKIFPHGNIRNITDAKVIPSPRPSDRVPFGTGKAINKFLASPVNEYFTYNPKTFIDLKSLIFVIPDFYTEKNGSNILQVLPPSIVAFLKSIDFEHNLFKIKKNSSSKTMFLKAFFQWFNGFIVLKYVHHARDNYYKDVEILKATSWILTQLTKSESPAVDKKNALILMRLLDKSDQ